MPKKNLSRKKFTTGLDLADSGDGLLLFDVGCSLSYSLSRNRCDKEYACNAPRAKDGRCTLVEASRARSKGNKLQQPFSRQDGKSMEK